MIAGMMFLTAIVGGTLLMNGVLSALPERTQRRLLLHILRFEEEGK